MSMSMNTVKKNLVCALPIYAIVKIWFCMGSSPGRRCDREGGHEMLFFLRRPRNRSRGGNQKKSTSL